MIEFRELTIHRPFRYLWLKYVTGHNLNFHCARCLVGEYSEKIKPVPAELRNITLDEHPAKIIYLCGVATPYNWSRNFHLALLEQPGMNYFVSENGITVAVRNAVPLPITTDAMNAIEHPNRLKKQFGTCRNWQFANFLEATGILDPGQ